MNNQDGTQSAIQGGCPYCSGPSQAVFHGGTCPLVKAIEYHPDGGVKRVEFHGPALPLSIQEALNSGDGTYRP